MLKSQTHIGLTLASMVVCLAIESSPVISAEKPVATTIQQGSQAAAGADEVAIRASATAFAKSFNAGDAKSIAAQWTEDGDYVNEQGQRYVGRAAIQQEYEAFFSQYPGVQIQIKVDSVKVLSPTTAIQEGTTTLGTVDAPSPVSSSYLAIYVKQNNQWMIASARDVRVEIASTFDNVADFEKFIGSWSCENGSTRVATTCRWIADKKYIERKFSVTENGAVTQTGVQIIGWNPTEQQISSWLFDSTGGHDFAIWTPRKNGWETSSTGYTTDGTPTSASNILTHVDDNSMTWKSIHRMLGDQPLADTGELVLKRDTETRQGR